MKSFSRGQISANLALGLFVVGHIGLWLTLGLKYWLGDDTPYREMLLGASFFCLGLLSGQACLLVRREIVGQRGEHGASHSAGRQDGGQTMTTRKLNRRSG